MKFLRTGSEVFILSLKWFIEAAPRQFWRLKQPGAIKAGLRVELVM
jgi:hypothetical protein